MIPYFPQPVWHIGRFEIHAFGIAAALALNAGFFIVMWRARAAQLDQNLAARLFLLIALAGAVAGHLLFVILNGGSALRVWEGQSAAGVAMGATAVAIAIYALVRNAWAYFNALAFTFPFVWMLVRAGCALAHDHPGRSTNSPLGVRFPAGTHYDLGLLEFLAAALLCAIFLFLARAGWRNFAPLVLIAAGAVRLGIEPLRLPGSGSIADMAVFSLACAGGFMLLRTWRGGQSCPHIETRDLAHFLSFCVPPIRTAGLRTRARPPGRAIKPAVALARVIAAPGPVHAQKPREKAFNALLDIDPPRRPPCALRRSPTPPAIARAAHRPPRRRREPRSDSLPSRRCRGHRASDQAVRSTQAGRDR